MSKRPLLAGLARSNNAAFSQNLGMKKAGVYRRHIVSCSVVCWPHSTVNTIPELGANTRSNFRRRSLGSQLLRREHTAYGTRRYMWIAWGFHAVFQRDWLCR